MSNKLVKVPKLKNGSDEEAATRLKEMVTEAQNGLRRVIALGMFCFEIKTQLKHGQFKPWLVVNCPDLSYRSLAAYMQLTEGVLKKCKLSIKSYSAKVQSLHFSHNGELLLIPDAKVPEEAKPLREKICSVIDGKSQSQLFFEFKQDDGDEEAPAPKRGNLKSKGRQPATVSPEAALEAQRKIAREDIQSVISDLQTIRSKFMVLSESKEDQLLRTTLQSELEINAKAISLWNNKPVDKRDPKKIEELFA